MELIFNHSPATIFQQVRLNEILGLSSCMEYKNLSWVWGWNRKIGHEDFQQYGMCDQQDSDQPAHTHSLIRAFASRMNIQWLLIYWPNIVWSFYA